MTDIESDAEGQPGAVKTQLPDTEAFKLIRPTAGAAVDEAETERVAVFNNLVTADDDIVGLVAYSIYKQHENDWLNAFRKAKSREPNEAETSAFIVGEGTARRLATYRHLAEATLAGRGPQVSVGASATTPAQRSNAAAARRPPTTDGAARPAPSNFLLYIALAVVLACAAVIATRYFPGLTGSAKP